MNPLTRRILKIVVFVVLFFLIGLLGTAIGVGIGKSNGRNNFRTPGWALIASIVVPGFLCLSPWANREIWKKEKNIGPLPTSELIDEDSKSTEEVSKNAITIKKKPVEQKLGTNTDYLDIIMPEKPNEKKEKLPIQKIVESKKESTETQQNSFESWKQLQSAKDPNYNRFSEEGLKELYEQEKLHENKEEPVEQKLGTNTDYLDIIMPEKPNEKKEKLPIQKIVESKPQESVENAENRLDNSKSDSKQKIDIISKEDARKELIELKNLLDMDLLTKKEFDEKAVELKKIILDK